MLLTIVKKMVSAKKYRLFNIACATIKKHVTLRFKMEEMYLA